MSSYVKLWNYVNQYDLFISPKVNPAKRLQKERLTSLTYCWLISIYLACIPGSFSSLNYIRILACVVGRSENICSTSLLTSFYNCLHILSYALLCLSTTFYILKHVSMSFSVSPRLILNVESTICFASLWFAPVYLHPPCFGIIRQTTFFGRSSKCKRR